MTRTAFAVSNGFAPKQGPKCLPVALDFTGAVTSIALDFLTEEETGQIDFVQGLWIDNFDNPSPLLIFIQGTEQRIVYPALGQGYIPITALRAGQLKMVVETAGNVEVQISLLNVPMAPATNGPINVTANISGIDPTVGTYTDHSQPVGTGVSFQIIAANPARKQLIIGAPSTNVGSIRINFTAPASAANSIELLPGGWYNSLGGPVSGEAITFLGAVTDGVIAKEM
jgi:hypothetical protein